jgi:hypothetical protein
MTRRVRIIERQPEITYATREIEVEVPDDFTEKEAKRVIDERDPIWEPCERGEAESGESTIEILELTQPPANDDQTKDKFTFGGGKPPETTTRDRTP